MAYFNRWLPIIKNWREEDHPRGKTVEGTNSGSFAPKEGGGAADVAGQSGDGWGVSDSRRDPSRSLETVAETARSSGGPAAALSAHYDDRRELDEVLAKMGERHGARALSEYLKIMDANTALVQAGKETVKLHWDVDVDAKGKITRIGDPFPERAALFAPKFAKAESDMDKYEPKVDPNDPPELVILGGLGGSGKSQFADVDDKGRAENQLGLYSASTHYVIDPDATKKWIPEYNESNATVVHEESSALTQRVIDRALGRRINTVIDITMSSEKSVMKKIEPFIKAGYRIKMGYMHLPRTEAASRAFSRWWKDGKANGRLVPIDIPLRAQGNEEAFDSVRKHADEWHLYSNDVKRGTAPRLIANGKGRTGSLGKSAALSGFLKYEEEFADEDAE